MKFFAQITASFSKSYIIAYFVRLNWQTAHKIVIITSTPDRNWNEKEQNRRDFHFCRQLKRF
jgi:hypothetical protein